jgi:hypothetical protein
LLPDILVIVLIANEQNVDGTKYIIERTRTVHRSLPRDRNRLLILPILGRDESFTEYVLSAAWRKRISDELGFTLKDWMPKNIEVETYFQKVFVPYYSYWSFGENLPVLQRESEMENPASISAAYGRITSLITSGLDWSVLEHSANPAEIELLRSKASLGEAKSVEYDRKARRRLAISLAVAFSAALVGAAGGVFYWQFVRSISEEAASKVAAEAASKVAEAQAKAERLQQQIDDMSKSDPQQQQFQITNLKNQVADLAKRNSDLLAQLQKGHNETTLQLEEILKKLGDTRLNQPKQ